MVGQRGDDRCDINRSYHGQRWCALSFLIFS